jgi:hypothetical protein
MYPLKNRNKKITNIVKTPYCLVLDDTGFFYIPIFIKEGVLR